MERKYKTGTKRGRNEHEQGENEGKKKEYKLLAREPKRGKRGRGEKRGNRVRRE